MIQNTPTQTPARGFTLIELLVVIAMIVVLASLGMNAFFASRESAKKLSARAAINSLEKACLNFFDDYSQLPLSEGAQGDQERLSNNELMSVLVGLESAADHNPKQTTYFYYRKSQGSGAHQFNGLDRSETHARLYGPWKNKQENDRFYRLVLDYDFDEMIDEHSQIGGERQFGNRVLIYHLGKDGQAGPQKNGDNVYSYK